MGGARQLARTHLLHRAPGGLARTDEKRRLRSDDGGGAHLSGGGKPGGRRGRRWRAAKLAALNATDEDRHRAVKALHSERAAQIGLVGNWVGNALVVISMALLVPLGIMLATHQPRQHPTALRALLQQPTSPRSAEPSPYLGPAAGPFPVTAT